MYLFEVYDINALLVYNFLSQFRVILNRHYFPKSAPAKHIESDESK